MSIIEHLQPSPYGTRSISPETTSKRLEIRNELLQTEKVIVAISGNQANNEGTTAALGESVIFSAAFSAVMEGLHVLGKSDTPVVLLVPNNVSLLYPQEEVAKRYPERNVTVETCTPVTIYAKEEEIAKNSAEDRHLILNFLGMDLGYEHPAASLRSVDRLGLDGKWKTISSLNFLAHSALVDYRERGEVLLDQTRREYRMVNHGWRRFADWVEEMFSLPCYSISTEAAEPFVALPEDSDTRYQQILNEHQIDSQAIQIGVVMQTAQQQKAYTLSNWEEVLRMLANDAVINFPGQHIDFNIFCGPDSGEYSAVPPELASDVIRQRFESFDPGNGVGCNILQLSLPDFAIMASHQLGFIGIDSGPMKVAAGAGVASVEIFMPGEQYPMDTWRVSPNESGISVYVLTHDTEMAVRRSLRDKTNEAINLVLPQNVIGTARKVFLQRN